jgi:hypothetical protein
MNVASARRRYTLDRHARSFDIQQSIRDCWMTAARDGQLDDRTITDDHNAVRETGAAITTTRDFVFNVTISSSARKTLANFQEHGPIV